MKKIAVFFLSLFSIFTILYAVYYFKTTSQSFVRYLKENPDNYSLVAQLDSTTILSHNPKQPMILASTMKIIIAIEFAYQVSDSTLNANESIAIAELAKYYIPYTDGGAHEKWLDKVLNDYGEKTSKVSLLDIAKGMIEFSSNANTEYLLDRLSLNKVNSRIDTLNLAYHEDINYLVSSLFLDSKVLLTKDYGKFVNAADSVHNLLKKGSIDIGNFDIAEISDSEWEAKLPKSTTEDYALLMQRINSNNYFPANVHSTIKQIMEWPMKYPKNKDLFYYIGGKGGNTLSVMTYASYAHNKEDNKAGVCIFLKNVSLIERVFLGKAMNTFIMDFLKSKVTRNDLVKLL
jgi:D-alanyl-D-alanine carboxypeptidase